MPLVDVHAHFLPASYLTAMSAAGLHDVDGFPLPPWSEAAHLATMDRHGITASILSISAPGIGFLEGDAARQLARRINEESAQRRERTRGRLAAFAVLTLPDVEGALREMEYALDVLGLDGVGLLTNVHGIYLGEPAFEEFFAEAERREAVVYTHPVAPVSYKQISVGFPGPAIEYPFDTTRMILSLLSHGTLRRHRKLKLIASHGGGAVPYLAQRIANLNAMFGKDRPPITPPEGLAELKSIYYDSTAVMGPAAFSAYRIFVPADRRLYGSDTPFMPESTIGPALEAMRAPTGLAADELAAIESGNALRIFPGLAALLGKRQAHR